jgi:hypothetical protein
MKLFTTTALEEGQVPPAPGDFRPFLPGLRIIAETIAEILFVLAAYL